MKVVVLNQFGGTENFSLQDVPIPKNKEGNLLIQIKATAFNPIDYQIRQGASERKLLHSPILGREFSGVVVADHSDFAKGDAVFGYAGSLGSNGTYAEYISIPQQLVAPMPFHLSFEEAASIPLVGLTALQCYERLQIPREASVFMAGGSGGVGTFLIKLLKAKGIDRIITTAGNQQSRVHIQDLGIEEGNIIDYHLSDPVQVILEKNAGRLFEYCIDMVGGSSSEWCSQLVKVNGVYADIANLTTSLARTQLFDKGTTVFNISNYAYALDKHPDSFRYYGQKLKLLTKWIEEGIITVPAIHCVGNLSVASVKKAHELLESNQFRKKLVMRIG